MASTFPFGPIAVDRPIEGGRHALHADDHQRRKNPQDRQYGQTRPIVSVHAVSAPAKGKRRDRQCLRSVSLRVMKVTIATSPAVILRHQNAVGKPSLRGARDGAASAAQRGSVRLVR